MDTGIRYFFYDLFFSMFVREPADAVIDAWRTGLAGVVEVLNSTEGMGRKATELLTVLNVEKKNEAVRSEFFRLFWSPDGPGIPLSGSYYSDGKAFGPYLIRMRTFLEKTPFRKTENYQEPEDSLAFHLDLMRMFILEENDAASPDERDRWRNLQGELVNDFLGVWIDRPLEKLMNRDTEPVYRSIVSLFRRFFDMEHEMFLAER